MRFEDYSKKMKPKVDGFIQGFIEDKSKAAGDPFLKTCYSLLSEYANGGKRLRPLAMLLTYESCGGKEIDKLIPIASAIELYHNYTLILDDLMDEDDFRRKKPTIHKTAKDKFIAEFSDSNGDNVFCSRSSRFGASIGILLGNLIGTLSRLAVHESEISKNDKLEVLYHIEQLDQWMCHGQALDIYRENIDISESDYIELVTYKTGMLFAIPMMIGSMLAGNGKDMQQKYFELGKLIALAFQLQDDLLDMSVSKGHLLGSDIRLGKRTLLFIKAYETDKSIKNHLGNEKVADAISLLRKTGSIDYCRKFAADKINEAKSMLNKLSMEKEHEVAFITLMDYFIARNV